MDPALTLRAQQGDRDAYEQLARGAARRLFLVAQRIVRDPEDGSDLRILTHTAGWAETPVWGPDGSWLIYALSDEPCTSPDCESHGFHETLWRMNVDGSDPRLVGDLHTADLSGDGRSIVYIRHRACARLMAGA